MAIVFCETRPLAEEWTYRYLAAARQWATTELAVADRIAAAPQLSTARPAPGPNTAEVRAWARANGYPVSDRGRIPAEVRASWLEAKVESQA